MKKRIAFALALVMMVSTALTACGGGGGKLTFTTGSDTGTYYAFGTVLAGQISDKTKTNVTAIAGKGSKANIEAMDVKDAQLGFVQSDVMAYAYNGERLFEKKIESFSTVAALYMEQVQIVTLDPNIKSVADLKGKNVSVGESGSGVYFNAVDILGAYGIDAESGISPVYQSFGESAGSLKDGGIDAAFLVAGAPTKAVADLAADKGVHLVGMDESHVNGLTASFPYFSACTVKEGTY